MIGKSMIFGRYVVVWVRIHQRSGLSLKYVYNYTRGLLGSCQDQKGKSPIGHLQNQVGEPRVAVCTLESWKQQLQSEVKIWKLSSL